MSNLGDSLPKGEAVGAPDESEASAASRMTRERAEEIAAEVQANGGSLTANEILFTDQWERVGWCGTKARASRLARERAADGRRTLVRSSDAYLGGWAVYVERER